MFSIVRPLRNSKSCTEECLKCGNSFGLAAVYERDVPYLVALVLRAAWRRSTKRHAAAGGREVDMKVLNIIAAVTGAIFRLVVAIAVVYLIYQGAGICYDYGYRIFTEPAISNGEGRTVTVTITESMSPMEIGELFESRGLVRDAKLFTLQYYLSEYMKDVGAGTFELSTAMTAEEMMAAMVVEEEETEEEETEEEETGE